MMCPPALLILLGNGLKYCSSCSAGNESHQQCEQRMNGVMPREGSAVLDFKSLTSYC